MMAPQAFKKWGLLLPDHQQIGCCASNGINSGEIPGSVSVLSISLLCWQASKENEKRFLFGLKILVQHKHPN